MKKLIFLIVVISVFASIMLLLSINPVEPGSAQGTINDKLQHFGAFLILSFFLMLLFSHKAIDFKYPYLLAIVLAIAYGILIEIIQYGIPYRSFSFLDMLADTIGSLAIILYKLF